MGKREIFCTRIGEMRDMIACYAISNGAQPVRRRKELSFSETLEVI